MKLLLAANIRTSSSEFVRFVLVGLANTGLTYLLFAVLSGFIDYSLSYTIVYVAGIFISYFLNARFAFGEQPRLSTLLTYPLVYIFQYILGLVLLSILIEQFQINRLIASPIIIIATLPVTFIASRIIFKQRKRA